MSYCVVLSVRKYKILFFSFFFYSIICLAFESGRAMPCNNEIHWTGFEYRLWSRLFRAWRRWNFTTSTTLWRREFDGYQRIFSTEWWITEILFWRKKKNWSLLFFSLSCIRYVYVCISTTHRLSICICVLSQRSDKRSTIRLLRIEMSKLHASWWQKSVDCDCENRKYETLSTMSIRTTNYEIIGIRKNYT